MNCDNRTYYESYIMIHKDYEIIDCFRIRNLVNHRIRFEVPLSYYDMNDDRIISIVANLTQRIDKEGPDNDNWEEELFLSDKSKVVSYIQGGPGFPCTTPLTDSGNTKVLLDKGYQILYMDQRGTGLSSPLEANTIEGFVPKHEGESENDHADRQLNFILNFRGDSIVEDLETIRKTLLGEKKWSILGQSFGGFCCFTYLSKYPESLNEVFVTGGIPPINFTPDDVYTATYERTKERNIHYYNKYTQDVSRVKNILQYLHENKVDLPNGGILSVERFQQLGLNFGANGGTDSIHQIVMKFDYDLKLFGKPTYQTLNTIQNNSSFDTNILYALFQEAIYCDGNNANIISSNWSADRLRYLPENKNFVYDNQPTSNNPIYFTGEMVFKSMYDDFAELRTLKPLAYALHNNKKWSDLYDSDKLRTITWDVVPIVAATYYYDQYVDFDICMQVKKKVFQNNGNLKQYITSEFFHNGVRANPEKVLGSLFNLLESEVD